MTKRIAAESEVRHGQTYWQIVDYDEECVIAELGCSPDAEALAEEFVKRWDAYGDRPWRDDHAKDPENDPGHPMFREPTGKESDHQDYFYRQEAKRLAKERDLEEARGK